MTDFKSFPPAGLAVVFGSSGGIGRALLAALSRSAAFTTVLGLSRSIDGFDITEETSVAAAAAKIGETGLPVRLVIVATGILHDDVMQPEKGLRQLDAAHMARSFAVNAIGPMLVAKHVLPLMPREGKAVFAALSAKVGSIGDNRLGGWYSYRAAKAALNQFVHTTAIELGRTRPDAICVALHPGTVDTPLSAPFRSPGHPAEEPDFAADRLLRVIDGIGPEDTGLLMDHTGLPLPW